MSAICVSCQVEKTERIRANLALSQESLEYFRQATSVSTTASPKPKIEIKTGNETTTTKAPESTTVISTTAVTTTTEKTTAEETTGKLVATVWSNRGKNLGEFKITVYVPDEQWGYSTATGVRSKHLQTCAVDPNVIPLGSTIRVNGLELYCCDTGSAVKGNVIDIFYDGTATEAKAWGDSFGMWHDVYLLEG